MAIGLSRWTKTVYDDSSGSSQVIEQSAYANGGTTTLLAKNTSTYDTSTRRLLDSRVYEMTSGSASGNYLKTICAYDDRGRRVRVTSPTGIRRGDHGAIESDG